MTSSKYIIGIFFPLILLPLGTLCSLCMGEVTIPIDRIFSILQNKESMEYGILLYLRIPRILLALSVGGCLSVVGAILQGVFRNPLVEPYTLGISGGALLGVALSVSMGLGSSYFFASSFAGFVGAGISVLLVYWISLRREGGMVKILLSGMMINFLSSSLVMLILALSNREEIQNILFWTMGSLQTTRYEMSYFMLLLSLLFLLVVMLFIKPLNALRFGEDYAVHWGINVRKVLKILFLLTSLITGISISVVGSIGFVGLLVPQFVRHFLGNDYRGLLLGSFLYGGLFLLVCDFVARIVIAPNELPVGVITGIVGGMVFVFMLLKKKSLS